MLDLRSTRHATLVRAHAIAKEEGLRFVYVGNVLDEERNSTYCPNCGRLLVRRRGYRVEALWEAPGGLPRVRPAHPRRMDLVRPLRWRGIFTPGKRRP